MAKKDWHIVSSPSAGELGGFVRHFQGLLLRLLKERGKLTETQYQKAVRLLEERIR